MHYFSVVSICIFCIRNMCFVLNMLHICHTWLTWSLSVTRWGYHLLVSNMSEKQQPSLFQKFSMLLRLNLLLCTTLWGNWCMFVLLLLSASGVQPLLFVCHPGSKHISAFLVHISKSVSSHHIKLTTMKKTKLSLPTCCLYFNMLFFCWHQRCFYFHFLNKYCIACIVYSTDNKSYYQLFSYIFNYIYNLYLA